MDKNRINITMQLSDEQVGWLIDHDSYFKEVLDNTQCRSYEDGRYSDLINVYRTNAYEYIDSFIDIINLIANRRD
jgi:hypothetical protein